MPASSWPCGWVDVHLGRPESGQTFGARSPVSIGFHPSCVADRAGRSGRLLSLQVAFRFGHLASQAGLARLICYGARLIYQCWVWSHEQGTCVLPLVAGSATGRKTTPWGVSCPQHKICKKNQKRTWGSSCSNQSGLSWLGLPVGCAGLSGGVVPVWVFFAHSQPLAHPIGCKQGSASRKRRFSLSKCLTKGVGHEDV